MLLAEAGYEQEKHDAGIAKIKKTTRMDISQAIRLLVKMYQDLYGVSDKEINKGMCNDFANDIQDIIPGAIPKWDSEDGSHCYIKYRKFYYDSECPNGVDNWRKLPYFLYSW